MTRVQWVSRKRQSMMRKKTKGIAIPRVFGSGGMLPAVFACRWAEIPLDLSSLLRVQACMQMFCVVVFEEVCHQRPSSRRPWRRPSGMKRIANYFKRSSPLHCEKHLQRIQDTAVASTGHMQPHRLLKFALQVYQHQT